MKYIILLILLYFIYKQNIEAFTPSVDDVKFFHWNDGNSGEFKHLPNSYYLKKQTERELDDGLFSYIYDYMGKDSHHYLFEAPILKSEELDSINKKKEKPQKSYISMIGGIPSKKYYNYTKYNTKKPLHRPIYMPDRSYTKDYNKFTEQLDHNYINDPFKYPYRHPKQLGNRIVYDFSNSIDFQTELRERELRLRGFHRTMLDDKNDYNEMTFCNNIDEEGTDFPCYKYGLKFNYDLENQKRLAKNNEYSASICCKQPL
tara:strand:- start:163 stop:939 length:777 start_codon:yes stop_codon:yes gene_type:complete